MNNTNSIKVWDIFVRFFHWSLVLFFFIAYLTEDDLITIHSYAGYIVLALILARIIWGFIGSKHARFKDFVYPIGQTIQYMKDTLAFKASRYIGHNPAGGLMIIILLISILITTVTGIMAYGTENAGPLAGLLSQSGEFAEDLLEEVHEFFANFTLLLVFIHIAGVVIESLYHRENLVKAMINGFKKKNN